MGDRVSISFRNGNKESVALFSHSNGMEFVKLAQDYVATLKATINDPTSDPFLRAYPLGRLEPQTVLVDFISRVVGQGMMIKHNFYLGATPEDGDNFNNGHHVIRLDGSP